MQNPKLKIRPKLVVHPFASRLAVIEQGQRMIISLLINLIRMETKNMTTLADLLAKSTALDDAAAAYKALYDGLKAHVADLETQLANALAAPQVDQATVEAINAKLDIANATLAGATAVVANTPVLMDQTPVPADIPSAPAV